MSDRFVFFAAAIVSVTLALCLSRSIAPATAAEAIRSFGEPVAVFQFARPQSESLDKYDETILRIADKVFVSELERAPEVGWWEKFPQDAPELDRRKMAKEVGVRYYVDGQYEFLKSNLRIAAQWTDVETGETVDNEAYLSKADLDDFDIVERKVRRLTRELVAKYVEHFVAGTTPGERLLVTCFIGTAFEKPTYLNSFITIELPFYLQNNLDDAGISSQRFAVIGLNPSEYRRECESNLESKPTEARYTLSGTIIQQGQEVLIKPLLFDQTRGYPLVMGEFSEAIPRSADLAELTKQLAQYLGKRIRTLLAQQRLSDAGFDPGRIDGVFGTLTRRALTEYQGENGLVSTGELDGETLQSLGF